MAEIGLLVGAVLSALVGGVALGAGRRALDTARVVGGASPASLVDLTGEAGAVLLDGTIRVDTPAPDPFPEETDAATAFLAWDHEEGIDRVHAAGLAAGRVAIDDGTGLAVLDASWLQSELAVAPSDPPFAVGPGDSPHLEIDGPERVREWAVEDALPADLSAFLDARGVDPHPYRSQEFRYRRVLDGDRVVVAGEFTDADGRPTVCGTDRTPMVLASGEQASYPGRLRVKAGGLLLTGLALGVGAVGLAVAGLELL